MEWRKRGLRQLTRIAAVIAKYGAAPRRYWLRYAKRGAARLGARKGFRRRCGYLADGFGHAVALLPLRDSAN